MEEVMEALTERQGAVLEFIRDEITRKGRPPTVREIGARFRFASTTTVRDHLSALERKGWIEREGRRSRNIALAPEAAATGGLPLVGRVAAGTPITAIENLDGYVSFDSLFASPKQLFCLRVEGDSMKDAGILSGDLVVVRQKPDFEDSEIGVAVIDGECTVKRLHRTKDGIDLVPANDAFDTMHVGRDSEFRYAGQVIGVHRVLGAAKPGLRQLA
jgi:repressor LexA